MKTSRIIGLCIFVIVLVVTLTSCDMILHQHNYGEWKETKAATCVTKGVLTRTCECGAEEVSETHSVGHSEMVDSAKPATCTETGLTEGKHCSVCDEVLVEQEVVPLQEHKSINGVCENCNFVTDPFIATINYVRENGIAQDDAYLLMEFDSRDGVLYAYSIATHTTEDFLIFVFNTNIDGVNLNYSLLIEEIKPTYNVKLETTIEGYTMTASGTVVASEITQSSGKIYDFQCDLDVDVESYKESLSDITIGTLILIDEMLNEFDFDVELGDFGFTKL